jgi:hypothetical protein
MADRSLRHGGTAAIHDEQVLMWELFWQSSRVPVDRAGPPAWGPAGMGPG